MVPNIWYTFKLHSAKLQHFFSKKKKKLQHILYVAHGEKQPLYINSTKKKKKTIINNCSLELDDKNSTAVCFDQIVVLKIGKKILWNLISEKDLH